MVFATDGILHIRQTHSGRGQFIRIHIHLDLPLRSTHNFSTVYFTECFKAVLHFIRILLQLYPVKLPTDIHKHDRHIAEGEFLHIGFGRQVVGQIGYGPVNRVFYFLFGDICFNVGIKLHHNQAVVGL